MKKDKPSKKKVNPESKIKEPIKKEEPPSPILDALLEVLEEYAISSHPLISPFKHLADKPNPFIGSDLVKTLLDNSQEPYRGSFSYSDLIGARIFSKLIIELYEFALHCKEFLLLQLRDEGQIKEYKDAIYSERDKISKLLTELIPKKAKKTLAHQFIRVCELSPDILFYWVNGIVGTLKKCREDAKKISPQTYSTKKALEIFCERVVPPLYDLFVKYNQSVEIKPYWENKEKLLKIISPDIVQDKNRNYSDTYTAIMTLSLFANCSYDKLYDLYYTYRKKIKKTNK